MLIYNDTTVADVLKMEHFRNAVLMAGEKGLKNRVSWMHPLEIWDDPNLWIDGGELIFSSALGIDKETDLVPYFEELLKIGIAGFCIQINTRIKEIPSEMVTLAEKNNCPLIVFFQNVRFIDLSRTLMNAIIKNVNYDYLKEKEKLEENAWLIQWINGELTDDAVARMLKKNTAEMARLSFFAVIIEYKKNSISYQWSEGIYLSTAKALEELFTGEHFQFYPFFTNGLLSAILVDYGNEDTWKSRFDRVVKTVNLYTQNAEQKPFLIIATGVRSKKPSIIPKSYRTAIETLGICQQFQTTNYYYEDMRLHFIFSLLTQNRTLDRMKEYTKEQLEPLIAFDKEYNGKLIPTLKAYYDCNGNKQLTAKALNIARPTIYYRLEQIREILGYNPLDKDKRLATEICLAFYDLIINDREMEP